MTSVELWELTALYNRSSRLLRVDGKQTEFLSLRKGTEQ